MHYVSIPIEKICLILQDLVTFVYRQVEKLEIQSTLIEHLREENKVRIVSYLSCFINEVLMYNID